jgi:3-oxoacyl-[acyl-carrier-protein] synthase II
MMNRRVAVTGIGLVSPHGDAPAAVFEALLNGESAIRSYSPMDAHQAVRVPAGRCEQFDAGAQLGKAKANGMDRFSQLGMAAALSAWQDARLADLTDTQRDEIGVFWGTGAGGALTVERGYRDLFLKGKDRVSPVSVILAMNNAAASHIALGLGLGGANFTYSVACASSSVAIGEAWRRIRSGEASVMLAGGSDTPLAYGVVRAWESLQVLAPADEHTASTASRPFATSRQGLVLAEGAGALILEEWEHAIRRNAPIYAELAGFGCSCDHSHLTQPSPAGQVRAIEQALYTAGLKADDIDYVNAHGTATREGDPAEIEALRRIFGTRANEVAISATKSMHGHLMGAAGVMEAIVTLLSLHHQAIPPTAHLDAVDPACAGMRHVARGERNATVRAAISNSFAFGGSNAVLAFRREAA